MEDKETKYAFPNTIVNEHGVIITGKNGMTLRDYFAAKAMQGMYSIHPAENVDKEALESDAEIFYRVADAMLKQREL